MKRKAMWTAVVIVLLATLAAGQAQEQYLDVYIAQVKPEKRAQLMPSRKKWWKPIATTTAMPG